MAGTFQAGSDPRLVAARAAPKADAAPDKNLIAQLFAPDFARFTVLLWLINFLSLLTIYFINSWLPSMLKGMGLPTSTAILAATMFQVGGTLGAICGPILVNALLGADTLRWALWLLPAMLVGIAIGQRGFAGVSPAAFRRRVLELLVVVSALTMLRAAWALAA